MQLYVSRLVVGKNILCIADDVHDILRIGLRILKRRFDVQPSL
jgi:hypothetical protein